MNEQNKSLPGQPTQKGKVLKGPREGGRKAIMASLEVGESVLFTGEPGGTLKALQASIASSYRGAESMSQQGLAQCGGILFFEGEYPTPVSKVTRERPVKEKQK